MHTVFRETLAVHSFYRDLSKVSRLFHYTRRLSACQITAITCYEIVQLSTTMNKSHLATYKNSIDPGSDLGDIFFANK